MAAKSTDPSVFRSWPHQEPSNWALTWSDRGKSPVFARNTCIPRWSSSLTTRSAVVSPGSVSTSTVLPADLGGRFMAFTSGYLFSVVDDVSAKVVAGLAVFVDHGRLLGRHDEATTCGGYEDDVASVRCSSQRQT